VPLLLIGLIFFRLFFLGPPPCYPGWPATLCACNGLWLLSHVAVSLKENNWFFITDQTPCIHTYLYTYVNDCEGLRRRLDLLDKMRKKYVCHSLFIDLSFGHKIQLVSPKEALTYYIKSRDIDLVNQSLCLKDWVPFF
jgi:hypothetical protein